LHNKPIGCGASGAYAPGPDEEEQQQKKGKEYMKLDFIVDIA